MNRKARRAAIELLRQAGAVRFRWESKSKHSNVTVELADGRVIDIGFHQGTRDEVFVRQVVKTRLRRIGAL